MLLRQIVARIPEVEATGNLLVAIDGISYDSRLVKDGHLFVAMKGAKTDGARYIQEAVDRGAVAIAWEQAIKANPEVATLRVCDARKFLAQVSRVFFRDPASELKLVAITGTNGKTTTSFLMNAIFHHAGFQSCLVGTIGMKIADHPFPSDRTTPESSDLLHFLREAVMSGCTHGVLEVSSHALALKRVFGTKFTAGVFSNLTPDHLDFHQDMESYYQAKRLLFTSEGANQIDVAAINTDDPWGMRLVEEVSCPVLRYGFSSEAKIRTVEARNRIDGTDLRIATLQGELQINTPLVGRPNTYNILAAVSAALGLGIDPEAIRRGVESVRGVPGRMELVQCGQPFTVVVDYAHTPDALEKVLENLALLPHRKIITVFGCGGDRDRTKRPIMGEIAARMSHIVVATSDNPRTEDPRQILAEIEPGLMKGQAEYSLTVDRREAIRGALTRAGEGDVVLIAGKGHEDYQIIGHKAFPFDDRTVAREILLAIS